MKLLRSLLKPISSVAGFTMIELLIVISILGILAVAVLSAINPVEQINRGRDTGSRSDAEQLLSAIDRFNAFQGYVPWRTGANDTILTYNTMAWTALDDWASFFDSSGSCAVLEKLSSAAPSGADTCTSHSDELKASFVTRVTATSYNHLFIYNQGGTGDSTYICFEPQSGAFATEALNKLDTDGSGTIDGSDNIPYDYPADAYGNPTDCGSEGICTCLP